MITAQTGQAPVYDADDSPELRGEPARRYPVAVVGAGPVGLCTALDLARHGVPVVVLDAGATVSSGSRAICFAKRSLEILDRLGCADRAVGKGVQWRIGKVFFGAKQIYQFDLQPQPEHKQPGFINLQQYYLEQYLIDRLDTEENAELRRRHRVVDLQPQPTGVQVTVDTPNGEYRLECDYLIAADGSRSPLRAMLGQSFAGKSFDDRFLIVDVVMEADFPPERWFWFEPPFFDGRSTLLHRQPDNVWRVDFQLGPDADPEEEKKPQNVIPKIKALLGDERPFRLEWVSVYSFSCLRMPRFVHGRVIFAGDAAHVVSPFGARGCNGGIQDADNLAWKLALVIHGQAPAALLDSYDRERGPACDENLRQSSRSTDFMTPKNAVSRAFRDAVLELAENQPFARPLVNSGRLSTPMVLRDSPLNSPDRYGDDFAGSLCPGAPAVDAPLETTDGDGWLLEHLGDTFCGLYFVDPVETRDLAAEFAALQHAIPSIKPVIVAAKADAAVGFDGVIDSKGLLTERYDGQPGSYYLFRPDQHLAGRWRRFDPAAVRAALARAIGREDTP